MMKKTPQQKKTESNGKDRRNAHGQNAKAAGKNVALRRRLQNRAERRLAHAAFRSDLVLDEEGEARATALVRRKYLVFHSRKLPDRPPGVAVGAKRARSRALALAGKTLRRMLFLTRAE